MRCLKLPFLICSTQQGIVCVIRFLTTGNIPLSEVERLGRSCRRHFTWPRSVPVKSLNNYIDLLLSLWQWKVHLMSNHLKYMCENGLCV